MQESINSDRLTRKFIELPVSDTLRAEAILSFSDVLYRQGKFKKSLEYAVAVFNLMNANFG